VISFNIGRAQRQRDPRPWNQRNEDCSTEFIGEAVPHFMRCDEV